MYQHRISPIIDTSQDLIPNDNDPVQEQPDLEEQPLADEEVPWWKQKRNLMIGGGIAVAVVLLLLVLWLSGVFSGKKKGTPVHNVDNDVSVNPPEPGHSQSGQSMVIGGVRLSRGTVKRLKIGVPVVLAATLLLVVAYFALLRKKPAPPPLVPHKLRPVIIGVVGVLFVAILGIVAYRRRSRPARLTITVVHPNARDRATITAAAGASYHDLRGGIYSKFRDINDVFVIKDQTGANVETDPVANGATVKLMPLNDVKVTKDGVETSVDIHGIKTNDQLIEKINPGPGRQVYYKPGNEQLPSNNEFVQGGKIEGGLVVKAPGGGPGGPGAGMKRLIDATGAPVGAPINVATCTFEQLKTAANNPDLNKFGIFGLEKDPATGMLLKFVFVHDQDSLNKLRAVLQAENVEIRILEKRKISVPKARLPDELKKWTQNLSDDNDYQQRTLFVVPYIPRKTIGEWNVMLREMTGMDATYALYLSRNRNLNTLAGEASEAFEDENTVLYFKANN